MHKNQYYKEVIDGSDYNYRLLFHKLQPGSLLIPYTKSVYQLLLEKVLKPALNFNSNYKIFQKIFSQSNDQLVKDLSTATTPITIFIPTDHAFKSLRQDQIDSLIADKKCGYKFLTHNIVYEEICPNQLIKYNSEYSSQAQRANFIAVTESGSSILYFNGQVVNLSKTNINTAYNGIIYRLSTLKLTGVVDFLYDIVNGFKKKFPSNFINSLYPNWMDVIKNEGTNSTLFMPFDDNKTLNNSIIQNEKIELTSTDAPPANYFINISDYLTKPRYSFYQLNDGDVLTSLSNKKYLISVYPFENPIPDYMNFIPHRNFQRKAINCQQLEMHDLSACSSQLIVFKSERFLIPALDTVPLLEYISSDEELNIFSNLLDFCGSKCKSIFTSLNGKNVNNRKGYTIILPTNDYFNKGIQNFSKYSRNLTLFIKNIQSNIFHGTYCHFYLRNMDAIIENLLNRKVKSKRVMSRITKTQAYLSTSGLIVHKTDSF